MKLKVSYKPQYLTADFDGTVREFFDEQTDLDLDLFRLEIEPGLSINDLYKHDVKHLSGGELQRVSIALALAKKADIFLLDEPSAFLDVEQRLAAARTIKRCTVKQEATTLVVDHDLVFQDYVSDRLLVFDGVPSEKGLARSPVDMRSGMNTFLKDMNVTFRRSKASGRPRANKPKSQLDNEQRKSGEYYYSKVI
ncbi:MAG: ATP-binding cassette domain-containing protein [Candidatus Diapherotrites archaeon]|nr:ATP-binding cassette domain-containing protein [Candidatus Diapherotrites archaeon]